MGLYPSVKIYAIRYYYYACPEDAQSTILFDIDTSQWNFNEFIDKYNDYIKSVVLPSDIEIHIETKHNTTSTLEYPYTSSLMWFPNTYDDIIKSINDCAKYNAKYE